MIRACQMADRRKFCSAIVILLPENERMLYREAKTKKLKKKN